jgi:hypothetical protein
MGELSRRIRTHRLIERSDYNPVLIKGSKLTLRQKVRVWLRGRRKISKAY